MVSQVAKQLVVSISGRFDRFDRNVLGRFDLLPSANFVQYLENMFLDETQKHCQEDHHWNLFSHLALKRHFLEKLEKETHFWPFFGSSYHLTSEKKLITAWNFQRSCFLMRFKGYPRIVITAQFFHLWHSSKETLFFNFSQILS